MTRPRIFDSDDSNSIESEEAAGWSVLARRADKRDVLDGRDIHCGDRLELQAIDNHARGIEVRYERAGDVALLYFFVGGHEFTARVEPRMRFRWAVLRRVR